MLVRSAIFALSALYLSLSSATTDVSSFFTRPRRSAHVTFLSFTSIPILPQGSISTVFLVNAIASAVSVKVIEPRFRLGSSTKERW